MRLRCIRIVRPCVAGGVQRAPGDVLVADDELARRGEPNCISYLEALGLVLNGAAVRPQDERHPPRYMTRAYA
jgi:hypothetical protein